jgi:endonuclease YncB( thermonuclease family)
MPSLPPDITRLADRRPGPLVRVRVAFQAEAVATANHANSSAAASRIAPVSAAAIQVLDGDTIRHQGFTVRLVGFNAPETGRRAACEAERSLGQQATRRLSDLVRTGTLDFQFVACSCPPGTEGTQQCNYGRRCGTLKVNGRDVGAILIAERLAVPFKCGATRCPATPRPWC